jgi:Ca-activated chloride channel family protein
MVPFFMIGIILYRLRMKSRLRDFADDTMISKITGSVDTRLQVLRPMLLLVGFAFLVIALARPKWGEKLQIYKGKGIDIVIALDASKSMLAQDIKPNRLDRMDCPEIVLASRPLPESAMSCVR